VPPDSTHSQDIVTAVIVAHDGAAWLPRVMEALAQQTRPVQRVVAVDTGSGDRSGAMLTQAFGRTAVFGMERTAGYGAAVAKALRHRAANANIPPSGGPGEDRTEWIWLLHDDSEPAPDALARLLAGAREAPAAAVLGPKIMDWNDRDVLLEAGTTIDRAGRRITGIEPREVDQGQHDGDRDVLAVSSAGMLARRDVWDELGGFDPGMRLFREDTDFCWRVQVAGYQVRVVTEAVVYHVEATARNRRQASAAPRRRRQDRRNALLVLTGNLPAWPMFAALAGNLVLSTLRTVFFLLAKRPAAAMDELAAYLSVAAHPLRLRSGRRIRARGRKQAFARLESQLPPGRSFRKLAEYATSTLSKTLPAEAVGSHHATDDPSDDDSLLVDTGLAQRLLTNPGVLLFLTLTVVALVAERSLLGTTPLGGGALVPAWGGSAGLWQEYVQGFHPVSIGTAASTPPYVALLAALATVLGGKPWLAVDVILLGCVPLAGATAYLASRRVTSYVPARVIGSLAYALLPVGMGAVASGRLGTAVLLVLLPPVAVLVGRVFTAPRRRARRAAWAAGLLTAVVAAFVPLFWLITAVVMGIGVLALRRRSRVLDALIVVLVPVVLLLPWSLGIAAHPARILLEAGLAAPGLAAASLAPRSLLLLSPGGPGLPPFWVTAGLIAAATVAVVAGRRRGLALAGWLIGVTGLITAAAVSRVAISQAGPDVPVRAWPGPALVIAGAGLLLAVVSGGDRVPGMLRAGRWRTPAGLAMLGLGVLACSAPALGAAYWVNSGVTGPVRPVAGPLLPEFVSVSSDTGQRLRTLVLQTAPHGAVTYVVLRDSDPLLGAQELASPTAAEKALSRAVATLTAPSGSAVQDQGRALAGFGIGYVLLPAPVNPGLAHLLDNVPGLRPVSVTAAFQLWRVVDTTARVTVTEANGTVVPVSSGPVSVTGARVPAAGGTLVIAEPAGGWSASLNGHPLAPLAAPVNGWAQGFRLPPGGGSLSVSHSDVGRTAVVVLGAVAVLVVIGLGLPGARTAAEAKRDEPARDEVPLAEEEAHGRRRAGHGRRPEERTRRRRAPRRGQEEPDVPPGTEAPRPALPARAFARRAAAVPAGIRAGWPHRGGPSSAEEPYPGDGARPDERSYPGSPAPEQPVPAGRGRRAAADLPGETVAYRAPKGDVPGRHSHRGRPDQVAGPGADPAPAAPQADREARERFSLPKRRGGAGAERTGRFGRGRGAPSARGGSGAPPPAPGGRGAPSAPGGIGGYDGGGYAADGYDRGGYDRGDASGGYAAGGYDGGGYPASGYDGGDHPSGPLPTGSYQGARSPATGHGRGSDDRHSADGGGYPGGARSSDPYREGRSQGGSHDGGSYDGGNYRGDSHDGGYPSGDYAEAGRSGDGRGTGRRRGRRGRSPGHARVSRSGGSGSAGPGPGGPAQQPPGRGRPAGDGLTGDGLIGDRPADDGLALAPLPPLPPLPPRAPHSEWDDPGSGRGRDDRGEADR